MIPCSDGFRTLARVAVIGCVIAFAIGFAPGDTAAQSFAQPFRPLTDDERLMVKSRLDPDADAEILDWDVRIEDQLASGGWRSEWWYYLRVKILTERGKDQWTRIDLPSSSAGGLRLKHLEGRTLQPDGTEARLTSNEIHERAVVRSGRQRLKMKSFVMPAVKVGSVVEARWQFVETGNITHYSKLPLSWTEGTPVRRVSYHVKPFSHPAMPAMRTLQRNCRPTWVRDPDGFYTSTTTNVRSFRREPDMPSDDQAMPWILVYYGDDPKQTTKFWKDLARRYYEEDSPSFKVTDQVRAAAARITGTSSGDEERLRALYDYCHREIRNLGFSASDTTAEEREQKKTDRNPTEVLKGGVGRPREIAYTFGALAQALGYEARMARIGRRDRMTLDPLWPDNYFLTSYVVAVNTSDGWRLFNPGKDYIPFNMLEDVEEGQTALLPAPDEPGFIAIPPAPPGASGVRRIATLALGEDGTLEGEVQIESCGHAAVALKEEIGSLAVPDRVDRLARRMTERVGDAELADVKIENADDPDRPVTETFHIRMPGYAQVTGRRVFLQPAVFQKAGVPRYSETTRRFSVQYAFAWSEFDSVTIQLPAGFEVEKAANATSHEFTSLDRYEVLLDELVDRHALRMQRKFGIAKLDFSPDEYPALKSDFDHLHRQDATVLVLVRSGAGQ